MKPAKNRKLLPDKLKQEMSAKSAKSPETGKPTSKALSLSHTHTHIG
jgi:hypothetical protein